MNKCEFITKLRDGLSGLPKDDIEERISFYQEIIDDRIEEGFSEEEAISKIGDIDEVVSGIIADTPFTKIAKERIKPKRRLKTFEIAFLIIGSPIWIALTVAFAAVIISFYLCICAVIISLWAVFASLIGCAFAGITSGAVFSLKGNLPSGVAMMAAAVICIGLAIFMFYGCKASTKGLLLLTRKIALWIKSSFIKKEAVQ